MVLTTGATCLGVIVLRIHHQGRRGIPVPPYLRKLGQWMALGQCEVLECPAISKREYFFFRGFAPRKTEYCYNIKEELRSSKGSKGTQVALSFDLFKKSSNNPNEDLNKRERHPSTPRFPPKAKVETETCSVTASDSGKKGPISPFLKVSRCTPDNSDMEDSPLNPVPDCPPSPAKKRWLKVGKKVESDLMKKEVK